MFYLVAIIVILVTFIYYKNTYSFLWNKNVKHDIPLPIFGNNLKLYLGVETTTEYCNYLYRKYPKEKIVGYYRGQVPILLIRDVELLKHVFNIDFIHFYKRGLGRNTTKEPMLKNAFFMDGDQWKIVRKAVSPAFTGSKLKGVFSMTHPNIKKLQSLAHKYAMTGEIVQAYDLMARFAMEFIGVTSYGINMDILNTQPSNILELGKALFRKSLYQRTLYTLRELIPRQFGSKISVPEPSFESFITKIISTVESDTFAYKKTFFFELLLGLRQRGILTGSSFDKVDDNGKQMQVHIKFDNTYMAAQIFMQFAGGFETSSCTGSYTLFELAHHPSLQKDIQTSIDNILAKYDDKICYDALSEMTLLSMVIKESLRIFPAAGTTTRVCTKDYKFPGTDLFISKGTRIVIPIRALHMDPQYYDEPTEFRPERFSPENIKKIPAYAYLPYGEGPRKCLGSQQGMYLVMAGVASILQKFTVLPASPRKYKLEKNAYLVEIIKGGIPIKLEPRINLNRHII